LSEQGLFDTVVSAFRQRLSSLPDKRTGKNIRYGMEDAALSAFSVFFTQPPSFLAYQRMMAGNNTLKTKGYNLEHNFGHGKQHLSSLLATLNILSLLFHTLLELLDQKYKLLRLHLPTRKTFFDDLRALTQYMYFDSWDHLLTFILKGLELDVPPNTS
jgi:hypothetical protein